MTSQGTAHGRFTRAIRDRHVRRAEMAAREMGDLALADALDFCLLLADADARLARQTLKDLAARHGHSTVVALLDRR